MLTLLRVGTQHGMAFWFHDTEACWANNTEVAVHLPWHVAIGLESACTNGGFGAVFLFVYGHQNIQNVPGQVMQRPADEYLKWEDAQAMHKHGVPVAHISDVVRMRAACKEGGVVLDGDLWWLRQSPPSPFVATLYEKRLGGRAEASKASKARYAAFQRHGRDGLGLVNTPFGVIARPNRFADKLGQLVDSFVDTYTSEGSVFEKGKDWNVLMRGVRDIVLLLDMGGVARPPIEFGAALSWHSHSTKPCWSSPLPARRVPCATCSPPAARAPALPERRHSLGSAVP